MISHTILLVLGGCLLGAIQLIAGIAIGFWIRRGHRSIANSRQQTLCQTSAIADRLRSLAKDVACSVGEHRGQLEEATERLTSVDDDDESLAQLVVDVIGEIVHANLSLQSKLETAECRLEEQAAEIEAHISRSLTDPLTGLPNRREFNDRLEERMAAWKRRQEVFSLLLLDVDHFKKLNDEHGHLAGDQVLAALGRVLRNAVRREDSVARYGGEEFAVLLPNTPIEKAICAAQKVRQAVADTRVDHGGQPLSVTVSGGLAMIGADEHHDVLIQRADEALYMAKEAGRNRAFVHDGSGCCSTDDYLRRGERADPAAALVELIHAPQNAQSDSSVWPGGQSEFGSYLTRGEISPELAQTCEELRHFVEFRGQAPQDAAPPEASSQAIAGSRERQ